MPNKKMRFPEVPGDTPRERFINLVRQMFSVSKTEADNALLPTGRKRRLNSHKNRHSVAK